MRQAVDKRIQKHLKSAYIQKSHPLLDKTQEQLEEYFEGERSVFNLPLLLAGTDFQKKVWNLLQEIPFGQTETYLGLSKKMGDVKAIRAVATANGANAHSIIIPCHRIIGSDGSLVGYAGGLPVKKRLLKLENAIPNNQLSLFPED